MGGIGCASINKEMASWVGHNESDLIAHYGPPQQTMSDGQGGKVFIYSSERSFTMPGYADTQFTRSGAYTVYSPSMTSSYNAYRMFWIGADGSVYRWAWKGLRNKSTKGEP